MKATKELKKLKKPARKNSPQNTVQIYSAEGLRLSGKIAW